MVRATAMNIVDFEVVAEFEERIKVGASQRAETPDSVLLAGVSDAQSYFHASLRRRAAIAHPSRRHRPNWLRRPKKYLERPFASRFPSLSGSNPNCRSERRAECRHP